jgi:hypothetical protein
MQRKYLLIIGAILIVAVLGIFYFNKSANRVPGGPCPVTTLVGECKITSIHDMSIKITSDIVHYYNYTVLAVDYSFTPNQTIEGIVNDPKKLVAQLNYNKQTTTARELAFNGIKCLLKPGIDEKHYPYESVNESCHLNDNNSYDCNYTEITREDLENCNIRENTTIPCKLEIVGGPCSPGGFEYFENSPAT